MNPILDASALLAYLHQEPGWEEVHRVVSESWIGAVNWCEVTQKLKRKGLVVEKVRSLLDELGLVIVPFSAGQAELAAHLWEKTRQHGLSLADRACLALAMERQAHVLTADQIWVQLELDIEIRLVR